MKPLTFAAEIELEGAKIYRRLADNSSSSEIKALFNFLADAEQEHYKLFIGMKKNSNIELIDDSTLVQETSEILKKVEKKSCGEGFFQSDIYLDILEVERKAADFYERKALTSINSDLREIYGKLAAEERRHQYLIESLIRFVNNPEICLEEGFKELLTYIPLGKDEVIS
ncbi:MAG TPA: hypothetical protein DD381_13425 [Lentisphaeria bacterium]|nr:MAG: hypothetical protein A2X47_09895 [Lentisphaerae bacterium GWF2_38_69]HBM17322.1 hypothetical protein [Lentisphaeria bacterium]